MHSEVKTIKQTRGNGAKMLVLSGLSDKHALYMEQLQFHKSEWGVVVDMLVSPEMGSVHAL